MPRAFKRYLGGHKVYFSVLNPDGTYQNEKELFYAESLSISSTTEFSETFDKTGCVWMKNKDPKSQEMDIAMTSKEFIPKTVAMVFQGSVSAVTQAADTAVAVVIDAPDVENGAVIDYGLYNCTGVVVTDATDAITYVGGIDYTLEANFGIITPIAGGAIVENEILNITLGTVPLITDLAVVTGMTNYELKGKLRTRGCNSLAENYDFYFEEVSISPDGDLDLMSEDPIELPFTSSVNLSKEVKVFQRPANA